MIRLQRRSLLFENPESWEALRQIINIFIYAYRKIYPCTTLSPITGELEVQTQYKYLLSDGKTTRDQDIKATESKAAITYIEFQIRSETNPLISMRSVEYFGLGIGHNKGYPANQIWLLEGRMEGITKGADRLAELVKSGIPVDEALRIVKEEAGKEAVAS